MRSVGGGRATLSAAVALAAISVAIGAWSVATFRLVDAADEAALTVNRAMLLHLWSGTAVAWAGLTALALALWRTRAGWASTTAAGTGVRAGIWVMLLAVALRAAVLMLHEPTLNDQLPRHLLDGGTAAAGVNPYLATPAERFEALRGRFPATHADRPGDVAHPSHPEPRFEGELDVVLRAGHPYLHSLTAPGAMHALAAVRWATPSSWEPGLTWRGVLCVVDLGVVALLLVLLRRRDRSAWWAALYAWHPLPLLEIAAGGHVEPLGILLMLVAFALAATPATSGAAKWSPWSALALTVRPIAALPALFLLLRDRSLRERLTALLMTIGIVAVIAGPLLLTDGAGPLVNVAGSVIDYLAGWSHFASSFAAAEATFGRWTAAASAIIAFGLVAVIVWRCVADIVVASRTLLVAGLLLAPIVHPWFLLWPLVLVPMRFGAVAWVFSLTALFSYAARQNPIDPAVSATTVLVAYVPVYATAVTVGVILLLGRRRDGRRKRAAPKPSR